MTPKLERRLFQLGTYKVHDDKCLGDNIVQGLAARTLEKAAEDTIIKLNDSSQPSSPLTQRNAR